MEMKENKIMRGKLMKKMVLLRARFGMILFGILFAGFSLSMGNERTACAKEDAAVVITGLTNPGEDSMNVGIKGTYIAGQQAALDRINEIRQEACKNGYPDPRNKSRALTMEDYVPIKWSSELEQYARIRAAEAVVYTSHARPGSNVYIDENVTYTAGSAEVLAWPGGTLKGGVGQWYGEKDTWVKQEDGVTGHYTSMINPNNTYVGLGGFMAYEGLGSGWGGCVCGRFMRKSSGQELDGTMASKLKNVVQVISIKKEYVSAPMLQGILGESNYDMYQGDSESYMVVRQVEFSPTDKAVVLDMDSYTFSSSDQAVLKIDEYGQAKALQEGKAVVSAVSADGVVYEKTVKVKSYMKAPKISGLDAGNRQLKVQFKATQDTVFSAAGFQIQIAEDREFDKIVKSVSVKTKIDYWNPVTVYDRTVKKLKAGKTYYVRVRAYMKRDGERYYTKWSKVKSKAIG